MNVQELIDELMKIEDKGIKVIYIYGGSGLIKGVYISDLMYSYLKGDKVTKKTAVITD